MSDKDKPAAVKFIALTMITVGAFLIFGDIFIILIINSKGQPSLFQQLELGYSAVRIIVGIAVIILGIGIWKLLPFAYQWLMALMRMPIMMFILLGFSMSIFGSMFGIIGWVIGIVFAILIMAALYSPSTRETIESFDYERPSLETVQKIAAKKRLYREPTKLDQPSQHRIEDTKELGKDTKICPHCNTVNHISAKQCTLCAGIFR